MAKPIFIIKIYKGISHTMMKELQNNLDIKLNDYHVIVINNLDKFGDVEFECYNSPKGMKKAKYKL